MANKQLRSEIKNPPNRQFAHFGVMDSGGQSASALFGSVVFNVILALIAIIIGASIHKSVVDNRKKDITMVVPLAEKPPEPPKPKVPPPPKLPPPPKIEPPKIEPPKIKLPDVKLPDIPKPIPVAAPKPVPVIMPAPPKIQAAAAAPKVMDVHMAAQSASVVNNDPHPSAVRLGSNNSPVPTQLAGPAVAPVNMNRGFSGMPPTNTGGGPPATSVKLGNGSPGGSIGGTAVAPVQGVKLGGCVGCTGQPGGNGTGTQVAQVKLGGAPPPPPPTTRTVSAAMSKPPVVLSKPQPNYTAEAKNLHIEGSVMVKVKVSAAGAVTVVGIQSGRLGHGLDESALQCAQGIKFKPAVDATGTPMDWEGVVTITFQMA